MARLGLRHEVVGWNGDDGSVAPGFPNEGSFTALAEGLSKYVQTARFL
jgi:hypothetical protein